MDQYLFVYGLLRRDIDHPAASYLRHCGRFVGHGYMPGTLYDTGCYPALVPGDAYSARVYGDVYHLKDPNNTLPVLDDFEEVGPRYTRPHEYVRQKYTIRVHDRNILCWVYVYNRPTQGLQRISSGDYIVYLRSHSHSISIRNDFKV
jgi:gamma-glutamylcyclotransferase (GGCT)/AIG2-like uncharacterized protein YtfP